MLICYTHLVSDDYWNICICFYPFTCLIQTLALEQLCACPCTASQQLTSRMSVAKLLLPVEPGKGQSTNARNVLQKIIPFAWTSLWGTI